MTTAHTSLVALLGHPVAHSLSPAIHGAALDALGIDAAYLAFDVADDDLATAVNGLFALGAVGANVTVPHKRAVMPLCVEIEDTARAIGAVNTLVRGERGFVGANTDADGFVHALVSDGVDVSARHALVIGAGGAARAVVAGLLVAGANGVDVVARREAQAAALVADLAPLGEVHAHPWSALDSLARGAALLCQTTSATLDDADPDSAFARTIPIEQLPDHAVVVDIVYRPLATSVMRRAQRRGLTTVDGLGMLIGQAALAFERWFGVAPSIEVMRRAADAAR